MSLDDDDDDDDAIYNVATYSDAELLDFLDVNAHASDRELEAKIVQMMNQYPDQRAFFDGIYRRFFDFNDAASEEAAAEGFETMVLQDKKAKVSKKTLDEAAQLGEAAAKKAGYVDDDADGGPDPRQTQSTVLTKALDYIKDPKSLNPTFNNTIQRVLVIDSRCRDRTVYPSSTDFTLNLTENLKNVLALNFYYVNVPYTWYTVSKAYGANMFFLNGNAPGIADVNHALQVTVQPGNYTVAQSIVDAVNAGLQSLAQTRPDITFGASGIQLASTTGGDGKATFTWDIQNRFGDSSYELKWPRWTSPASEKAQQSVPGFLGFLQNDGSPLSSGVMSNFGYGYVAGDFDMVSQVFQVDATNNYFTILNLSSAKTVLDTIVVRILPVGAYNRTDLVQKVCQAMQGSDFLNPQYSGIFFQQDNFAITDGETDYVQRFRLTVQLNRFRTANEVGQTQVVVFPDESTRPDPHVWTGPSSAFFFDETALTQSVNSTAAELGSGLNDVYDQTGYASYAFNTYEVSDDPQIKFTCKKMPAGIAGDEFNRANSFSINIPNAPEYTLNSYLATINDNFKLPDSFKLDDTKLFQYDYYGNGLAYLDLGFQRSFNYKNYKVDATGSVLSTVFKLPAIMDFATSNSYTGSPFAIGIGYLVNNANRSVKIQLKDSASPIFTLHLPYAPAQDRPKHSNPHAGGWYLYSDLSGVEAAFNGGKYGFGNVQNTTAAYQRNQGGGTFSNPHATTIEKDALYGLTLTGTRISFALDGRGNAVCTLSWSISNLLTEQDYEMTFQGQSWSDNLGFVVDKPYKLSESTWSPVGSALATVYADFDVLTTSLRIYNEAGIYKNNQLIVQPRANADSLSVTADALTIEIPPGTYNRFELVRAFNAAFAKNAVLKGTRFVWCGDDLENVRLDWKVNKVYGAQDYTLTFFDIYEFGSCINHGVTGNSSLATIRWEQTLGWLLGFRSRTAYNLSEPVATSSNADFGYSTKNAYKKDGAVVELSGDTPVNINIYNQLHIVLDDFTSNHMNDGIITVAPPSADTITPAYANRAARRCDPVLAAKGVPGGVPSFSNTDPTRSDSQGRAAPLLTQNQLYAALATQQSRADLNNKVAKTQSPAPNVKDMFALVPLKLAGLQVGQAYTEFGGTLQQSNRKYYGPVNIRRIGLKLLSDRGDIVDLNNNDWSVGIICDISIQS